LLLVVEAMIAPPCSVKAVVTTEIACRNLAKMDRPESSRFERRLEVGEEPVEEGISKTATMKLDCEQPP
jgi:hypothetical protein